MRVLRAFRLLRLLGKMGDLKKIVTAVAISLIPTLQALVSHRRLAGLTVTCVIGAYLHAFQSLQLVILHRELRFIRTLSRVDFCNHDHG